MTDTTRSKAWRQARSADATDLAVCAARFARLKPSQVAGLALLFELFADNWAASCVAELIAYEDKSELERALTGASEP